MFYFSPPWKMLIPLIPLSEELAPMPDVRRFLEKGKMALFLSALVCFVILMLFLPENYLIYNILVVFAVMCIDAILINSLYFKKITELARNADLFTGAEGLPVKIRFIGFGLMDIFARIQPVDSSSESLSLETVAVAAANRNPLYVPPSREIQGVLYKMDHKGGELGIVSEDLVLCGKPATETELDSKWYVAILSMVGLIAFGLFMLCCFIILVIFQPKEQSDFQFYALSGAIILLSSLITLIPALFLSKMIQYKKLLKAR